MDDVHRIAPLTPSAQERMAQRRATTPGPGFQPLPPPSGPPPYRRALADVIGELDPAAPLRFHCAGDTGGWRDPEPQRRVAAAMAAELTADPPARFFYNLGDVVYPHGEREHYHAQLDVAYRAYAAPIFAVPGNHDAESERLPGELALAPFRAHFCTDTPRLHEAGAAIRPPARQPHVHWTLVHDRVRIVGLWANVPEGGEFAPEQLDWFTGELRDTPPEATLILALHQPVYSTDRAHGSNLALVDLLDTCAARAGRAPDAVFSGHAHLYERFTRSVGGREVPYVVAGAGGFPDLHRLADGVGRLPAHFPGVPGVRLDAVEDRTHGFLTVTVGERGAEGVYTAVGPDGARPVDAFAIPPPAA